MECLRLSVHFAVGFSVAQLIKGLKKDSETKGMWGLFATKGVDSPGTEEVALNLESLITPVHP